MKFITAEGGHISVSLTEEDLLILNNALNEVCNGLDIIDFTTRIGASREHVKSLLDQVGGLFDMIGPKSLEK